MQTTTEMPCAILIEAQATTRAGALRAARNALAAIADITTDPAALAESSGSDTIVCADREATAAWAAPIDPATKTPPTTHQPLPPNPWLDRLEKQHPALGSN
jgi:hypothetical protein